MEPLARSAWKIPLVVGMALIGCKQSGQASPATTVEPAQPAANAFQLIVAYGSEKKSWVEEQIAAFNQSNPKLPSGAPFTVEGKAMGSGEAMQDILRGDLQATVYSPASEIYLALLNDAWLSMPGHAAPIAPRGESVVISPMVIAMWKPMAEALGWPKKSLGWGDVLKIVGDKRGWQALGRAEWGHFKLGHTHPEYSTSGLLSVIAEAYAGAKKTRDLGAKDLAAPKTRAFLRDIEKGIVHYGKSTGFFADKMLSRGPSYLSAAVLYESSVIESYATNQAGMDLVSIYPKEGTFWSDHPYAILDAPWVSADQRKAAEIFLARLKARPAQERALALGFRPADPALAIGAPIDAAHGADPKQPQTLLATPSAATVKTLLEVFREVKKPSDVTLIFDKSGSMKGDPLEKAKAGGQAFLRTLQPRDQVSLQMFDDQVHPIVGPVVVGKGIDSLLNRIGEIPASGGTALYDAIDSAYRDMKTRASKDPDRIHALVVMTDGKDEHSSLPLADLFSLFPSGETESDIKVFTIAYGQGAKGDVLPRIAEAGGGSHSQGDVKNIVQVYRDIASFF